MASSRRKSPPFVQLLASVQQRVDIRLGATLRAARQQTTEYGPEVEVMVAAVDDLCSRGGKRLRPALCVVGGLCVDPTSKGEAQIEAGVALELLQAYFLIHDDWMDHDSERRGGPTAHVTLTKHFGSEDLGTSAAILAGDYAVSLAQSHLAQVPATPARVRKAFASFAEMQLAAVMGQQLDIVAQTEDPELTYELKTSSYTVRGPLRVGAELAGASASTLRDLDRLAKPIGVGFQLRDDLIGVFGDPKKTGKPRGADLTAGKNTSLVKEARRLLNKKQLHAFDGVFGKPRARSRQVEKVVGLLEECGARAAVEARIAELRQQATEVIAQAQVSPKGRRLLEDAVVVLCDREM